jgi:pyridoxine/pyridoxamine 5'-phosphate oxidase
MPVWGVWLDDAFHFATDRASRKARNLAANPAVVVHLESGDDVVLLEGRARPVTDPARLAAFDAAYQAKYGVRMADVPGDVSVWVVTPRVAFGWHERDFPGTATRWRFGGSA